MSSFWILAANSWMQTPAGYEIIDGRFYPTDWLQVIFNPSFPPPARPHRRGVFHHHVLRRARRRRLSAEARAVRRGRPHHAVDGALAAHGSGSAADSSSATIMGSTRGSTSPRNSRRSRRAGRPDAAFRSRCSPSPTRRPRAIVSRSRSRAGQPDPDSRHRRRGQRPEGLSRPISGRPLTIPFFAFPHHGRMRRR